MSVLVQPATRRRTAAGRLEVPPERGLNDPPLAVPRGVQPVSKRVAGRSGSVQAVGPTVGEEPMTLRAILVLDDPDQERAEISASLTEHGYEVAFGTRAGSDRLKLLATSQTDLVVLDAGGACNGDALLRAVASSGGGRDIPVVRLADGGPPGAEAAASTLSRLKKVVDRLQGVPPPEPAYRYRQLEVDFQGRRVLLDGREVHLTAHEFGVLCHLARHAARIRSVAEIFESAWSRPYRNDAGHVWTYVRRLRRKLEPDPARPVYLLSRAGLGYLVPAAE